MCPSIHTYIHTYIHTHILTHKNTHMCTQQLSFSLGLNCFGGAEAPATLGRCVQNRGHLREGPINRFVLDTVQK